MLFVDEQKVRGIASDAVCLQSVNLQLLQHDCDIPQLIGHICHPWFPASDATNSPRCRGTSKI